MPSYQTNLDGLDEDGRDVDLELGAGDERKGLGGGGARDLNTP
jgi:hypothetical protein